MVTIYDIAKKANVSPMTVSRVINKTGKVSENTESRVEDAIKELGYVPNSAARSLTSKKTKLLSLLITDITNPFFTKLARGAEDKAMQMGYQILLSNTDESLDKESAYIDKILSTRVDGVLIAPTGDESIKHMKKLRKHNIPVVLIDREIQGFEGDLVLGDNYEGSRRLVEHLIQLGHKRIALINGPANVSTARERQRGYEEMLKLSGLQFKDSYISHFHYKKDDADKVVLKLLSFPKKEQPTALFAANNFIAVTAIQALKSRGINVPEDIAVVCFDDIEPIANFSPFLTVASQPAYSYGYLGIQFLIERIEGNGPKENRRIVLPPEIIIRKSSQSLS